MRIIKGQVYRHYKGGIYKIICIAKHSENKERLVIYQDQEDLRKIWARPEKMFSEIIKINNISTPRFKFIKDEKNSN